MVKPTQISPKTLSNRKQALGRYGEDTAARMLQGCGYLIVERNWRRAGGEIDLVARDGDCWVFVEVKTRHGHASGWAEDGMTARKAERITNLGQAWLAEQGLAEVDWRIDLVAIELDARGAVSRVNHVKAVTADRVG